MIYLPKSFYHNVYNILYDIIVNIDLLCHYNSIQIHIIHQIMLYSIHKSKLI